MKPIYLIVVSAALAAMSLPAAPQFVKGNEAIELRADGQKRVQTPPLPARDILARPCTAATAGCAGGGWNMVETPDGLMECTEIYARPGTCRPSRYGTEKRPRLWIVKSQGQWLQCQYPDLGSKCVSTKALPFDAIQ